MAEAPLRPQVVPTSSSSDGGRLPRFASFWRGSGTAGRWYWPSTICSGATWTARLLLSDLLRPPDAPVLLLVGSYRSEYATFSPFLRVLLHEESNAVPSRDHRDVPLEPLTLEEGANWRCD